MPLYCFYCFKPLVLSDASEGTPCACGIVYRTWVMPPQTRPWWRRCAANMGYHWTKLRERWSL